MASSTIARAAAFCCFVLLWCDPSPADQDLLLGYLQVEAASERIGPTVFEIDPQVVFAELLKREPHAAPKQRLAVSHLVLLAEADGARAIPAQWSDEQQRLTWFAGMVRTGGRYALLLREGVAATPFEVQQLAGRRVRLLVQDKPVLQYNHGIVRENAARSGPYDRACYVHPIWTPSGAVVTGDFSPEHIHQRGLFTAWVKAKFGDIETDFWGLGESQGRILPKETAPHIETGPVYARLVFENRAVFGTRPLVEERVELTVYAEASEVLGNGWLFDLRTQQTPIGNAMELPKIYYGGTSFRGPGEWLARDSKDVQRALARGVSFEGLEWLPSGQQLDVLTSEGSDRKTGDRQAARWIDFTGPRGDGWGGVAMFDSATNPRFPTPLRIHPGLPYFSYALVQKQPFVLPVGEQLRLDYRLLAHDGRPDGKRNERLANTYTRPPKITWQPAS